MSFSALGRNLKRAIIPDHAITRFFGNNTELSDIKTMGDGFSPDSLNWITGTEQDMISLRRGTALLGQTRNTGSGVITGLGVGTRYDGTQIPFFSYGRKVKYYDLTTDDTIEIGSNLLPAAADGDECSINAYQGLAGAFAYISSINSSVYKIPVANPGSAVDQVQADYKGFLKFGQSRSILINRKGSNSFRDSTGLYMSWVDKVSAGDFTQTVDEAIGGAGATHFTKTLAARTGVKTAFEVFVSGKVAAGIESFIDDHNGSLLSNFGGTGTINYATGALDVTFSDTVLATPTAVVRSGTGLDDATSGGSENSGTAHQYKVTIDGTGTPDTYTWRLDGVVQATGVNITGVAQVLANGVTITFGFTTGHTSGDNWTFHTAVVSSYRTEDATSHGVLDFSFAGTRVAGTGRYFSQFDGGGPLNTVISLANVFYGFHSLKTWQTTIPSDDDDQGASAASNLPFREKMGVTYPYSAYGGATGIYYINNSNPNRPEVYQLQLFTGATAANIAHPALISKALNLSSYQFDKAVVLEWGIYVLICFQQIRNGVADSFNSRMFLYNKKSGTWDLLDCPSSRLAEYNGTLLSGDPLTNNIFTLFSGFDDDGSLISNYWTSGFTNHGVPGQKVHNRMVVDGLIQASQNADISLSFDGGAFVKVFTISGTGTYVDSSKSIAVGSYVEGSKIIGGGATVYANPFQVEFSVNTQRYEYVRFKIEGTGGGYLQMNYYKYKDIRYKGARSMPIRTV